MDPAGINPSGRVSFFSCLAVSSHLTVGIIGDQHNNIVGGKLTTVTSSRTMSDVCDCQQHDTQDTPERHEIIKPKQRVPVNSRSLLTITHIRDIRMELGENMSKKQATIDSAYVLQMHHSRQH